jgi:DNA polymerase elongation subunit (family B)
MRCNGWIFDAYPVFEGMRVWAVLVDGRRVNFVDPWRAPFIVDGTSWGRARPFLSAVRHPMEIVPREGADLYSEKRRPGWEVRVPPPVHGPLVKKLKRVGVVLYNADFHLVQHYHYERGHFPLAFGTFCFDANGLKAFLLQDDPWSVNFSLPPLRFLHVALAGSEFSGAVNPTHASRGGLILRHEGMTHVLEGDPAQQMESLNRRILEWDPDVFTTDWGDSYLIPHLLDWSRRVGQSLPLSRDLERGVRGQQGRSFMTYGQMVYQSGAHYLFGRWHLDLKNSFYFKECGWEGLYEIARIAKIPVQRAARTTIGTSLSSMQLDVALRRGLWVPMEKAQVEDFRLASDLVVADKGGLVYEPDIGWFENVAEYDFVSMYPTLMVKHNISSETINCECCDGAVGGDGMVEGRKPVNRDGAVGGDGMVEGRKPVNRDGAVGGDGMVEGVLGASGTRFARPDRGWPEGEPVNHDGNRVPEIGHHLCHRRQGLVPEVLAPILKKRAEYKRLYKEGHTAGIRFKARAAAHKWTLVCCFGYLGYKNARFGKIEAHESVTAWGRETLLRAKEFVEDRGFHVLHANVDCVWIQGRSGMDYESLRHDMEEESGCPLGLEGVYKWLRFCPSKEDPLAGVPNRYFGAFTNGELKIRGLAVRRRDTPKIFKNMQKEMLAILAEADDVAGCRARTGRLSAIAEAVRERIAEGRVSASELAVTFTLSKDPSEYVGNGPSAVAAKRLALSGVRLHAGETVRYIITSSGDKVLDFRATPLAFVNEAPEVDTKKYIELWQRCREEIMDGLEEKTLALCVSESRAPFLSRRKGTEDHRQGQFNFVEK